MCKFLKRKYYPFFSFFLVHVGVFILACRQFKTDSKVFSRSLYGQIGVIVYESPLWESSRGQQWTSSSIVSRFSPSILLATTSFLFSFFLFPLCVFITETFFVVFMSFLIRFTSSIFAKIPKNAKICIVLSPIIQTCACVRICEPLSVYGGWLVSWLVLRVVNLIWVI